MVLKRTKSGSAYFSCSICGYETADTDLWERHITAGCHPPSKEHRRPKNEGVCLKCQKAFERSCPGQEICLDCARKIPGGNTNTT